jgi:hypothetical protein
MFWAGVLFITLSVVTFVVSLRRCQNGSFYDDTFILVPLGIYVWGDALILAPFWILVGVGLLISPIMGATPFFFLRFYLLFLTIRSAYEVVYWINHQVAQKNYIPPLFRRFKWLGANEGAILYQLLHTCAIVGLVAALFAVS